MTQTQYAQWAAMRQLNEFSTHAQLGNLYFTDNSTGSNATANGGYWPSNPSLTLMQAHALTTAANGDVVFVGAGHAETITGAAGMTFSNSGVTYIGCGNGRQRPYITSQVSSFDENQIQAMILAWIASVRLRRCQTHLQMPLVD